MSAITGAIVINTLLVHGNATLALQFNAFHETGEAQAIYGTNTRNLMHGVNYQGLTDYENYYISEKLDGVRAYWDGYHLWSRQGLMIWAPSSLLEKLPNFPLDGELWFGRGKFQQVASLIAKNDPDDPMWRHIQYGVFDLPTHTGTFAERYLALKKSLPFRDPLDAGDRVFVIRQHHLRSKQQADNFYQDVVDSLGEGVMYHHQFNYYSGIRSPYLLKRKPTDEVRVRVIGYKAGQGKYEGQVGSLIVENDQIAPFRVGSGLTDELRQSPPQVGSEICVRHTGYTQNNVPRFPRYIPCVLSSE